MCVLTLLCSVKWWLILAVWFLFHAWISYKRVPRWPLDPISRRVAYGAYEGPWHATEREYRSHLCVGSRLSINIVRNWDSTIILEMNLGTQTSAIRLDAFVQMEKVLVFANGAITFDA
ncbi:hypothetical protein T492DRAFT_848526 [Pavlovales sp. CCMP2436]|nr:hypothetical protein T492DRAFT_848526 [Pavlovales sp. CCMP2436]